MKPQVTSYKVVNTDYSIKETWDVPDGTIYKTEIDGHDFCILESHSEKSEKLALELSKT
jgi:hypothetical protein